MSNYRLEAEPTMTQRAACGIIATAATGVIGLATETSRRTQLGLVAYNCGIRRKVMQHAIRSLICLCH